MSGIFWSSFNLFRADFGHCIFIHMCNINFKKNTVAVSMVNSYGCYLTKIASKISNGHWLSRLEIYKPNMFTFGNFIF